MTSNPSSKRLHPRSVHGYKQLFTFQNSSYKMSRNLLSVDFEIHGKVQGVHFRKYTQEQGKILGLKGWCMNTKAGTVIGNIQGAPDKILKMKNWLRFTGSPKSRIDKAEFKNEQVIPKCSLNEFVIRK